MSGILIKDNEKPNETIERGILRKAIRENWGGKTSDATHGKMIQALDDHAAKMEALLGTFEYGILCMPNIISNSSRMSERELTAYLSLLEALGTGIKHLYNSEWSTIFLAGLTLKARDLKSASRHLDSFMQRMEKKFQYYQSRSEKENRSMDELLAEIDVKGSGLLKFFRKGELNALNRMVTLRSERSKMLSSGKQRYSGIMLKVRSAKK